MGAYLDIPSIIDLAQRNVDAIHPGYGFLSENADFARACEAAGINFIGPPSTILGQMGDKLTAKATAKACKVPIIPGSTEPLKDAEDDAVAKGQGVTASPSSSRPAGGGGRGMRRCDTWWSPSTSRCRCWPTSRATWCTWASATARSSGATRRWWSSPPPSPWTRRSVRPCMKTR